MSSLPRLLALILLALIILIVAGLGGQVVIQQQRQRLLENDRSQLAQQLAAAVALTGGEHAPWTPERLDQLARVTRSQLKLLPSQPSPDEAPQHHVVTEATPGVWLGATRSIAATQTAVALVQRVVVALGVFALLVGIGLVISLMVPELRSRTVRSGITRNPFNRTTDIKSLSFLAHKSVKQQEELLQERDERIRAEGDARSRLQLLNRALEEKVRIGRDLHDGVIQSLYAAGLNLESAKTIVARKPAAAEKQLGDALDLINRTIGDIRAYIAGLSPLQVRRASLAQGVRDCVDELRAGRTVDLDLRIDDHCASLLSDEQTAETLQITREAVSNALRHGAAQHVFVSLGEGPTGLELTLRDDGIGFDPGQTSGSGHGLTNMRARVEQLGGAFELKSAPQDGTCIKINWITTPPAASP